MKLRKTILLFVILCLIGLVSCGGGGNDKPGKDPGKDPGIDPTPGPIGGDTDETPFDFMGQDFIIMVNDQSTIDPRKSTYQQLFKEEKTAKISAVESKYNLKVVYKNYPSEASWGGARERYVINNSISKVKSAHVYELSSYSIATIAKAKAISPLTTFIEKYGVKGYWPNALQFGKQFGEFYGYSDIYPLADEGLYYNIDLMEKYLGEGNGDLPSRLWLEGKWDWDKFTEICKQLDEAMPDDYYVLGGMTYNWAYQMLGANGVHVVTTDFKSELATQEGIDTITYMNNLYHTVRWDAETPSMSNATSTHMVEGKVGFHNGQSYWIFQDNKWKNRDFKIGFVPYPVGPNVKDRENLSDYYINDVYGKTQYSISSAYDKSNVPAGYEDSTLYDEIIFKIWADMQYFPGINPETGYIDDQPYLDEYELTRLGRYYGGDTSVEAHLTIIRKSYPDFFYSIDEAKNQDSSSYMVAIQSAVKNPVDDVRSSLTNIAARVHATFKAKYELPDDYYKDLPFDDSPIEEPTE